MSENKAREAGQSKGLPPARKLSNAELSVIILGYWFFDFNGSGLKIAVRYSDRSRRVYDLADFLVTQRERYDDFRGTQFEVIGAPKDRSQEIWERVHLCMAKSRERPFSKDRLLEGLETAH